MKEVNQPAASGGAWSWVRWAAGVVASGFYQRCEAENDGSLVHEFLGSDGRVWKCYGKALLDRLLAEVKPAAERPDKAAAFIVVRCTGKREITGGREVYDFRVVELDQAAEIDAFKAGKLDPFAVSAK